MSQLNILNHKIKHSVLGMGHNLKHWPLEPLFSQAIDEDIDCSQQLDHTALLWKTALPHIIKHRETKLMPT